jgi:hypothetical protein
MPIVKQPTGQRSLVCGRYVFGDGCSIFQDIYYLALHFIFDLAGSERRFFRGSRNITFS